VKFNDEQPGQRKVWYEQLQILDVELDLGRVLPFEGIERATCVRSAYRPSDIVQVIACGA
jgi:hypothetical protein